MKSNQRRDALKLTTLGIIGLILPDAAKLSYKQNDTFYPFSKPISRHFPNIDPEVISQVVGKSHADLDTVMKMVNKRPELARSVWEWRFGDFESAIGAASHVGRRDIVQFLISKDARPTIFTFAMMGNFQALQSIIQNYPGMQKTMGPHGISLLDHAYAGERMKDNMDKVDLLSLEKTIAYLQELGDAGGLDYLDVSEDESDQFLGDYYYGSEGVEGFTVQLNMRKMLSLAPIGGFGGAIYKTADHTFIYNGAPSVQIRFNSENNQISSLTVTTPEESIVAVRS
ncbi:hypothetical protein [Portibacter marinus]|uniref:hypothetical protein n=1 Tax=Portibacter marinus TaxID=2898660 RepID=UPI001F3F50A1|nr:hypothetical protein [Portibacter marinus]